MINLMILKSNTNIRIRMIAASVSKNLFCQTKQKYKIQMILLLMTKIKIFTQIIK